MKPNTRPRHPFGLLGIQTALLSHHVLQSGTHQALSMPARNRESARALAVLNIELEIGPFPLEPNTRCALGKPTTAALPQPSSLEWAKARFGREKPIYD